MALTCAAVGQQGLGGTIKFSNVSRVSVSLVDAYATGGFAAISTLIKTVIGSRATILDIQQGAMSTWGGYLVSWVRSTDKLIVYGTGAANKAAMTQVDNGSDLSAITAGELLIFWI